MSTTQSTIDLRQPAEARVQEVLATLPVAAYTCDVAGHITFFNERAADLWGRRPNLHDPAERYCGSMTLFTMDGAHDRPCERETRLGGAFAGGNRARQPEIEQLHAVGCQEDVRRFQIAMHEAPTMQRLERSENRQRDLNRFGAPQRARSSVTARDSPSRSSMARNSSPFSSPIS